MSSLSDQFRRLFSGTLGLLPIVFPNRAQGGTLVHFWRDCPSIRFIVYVIVFVMLAPAIIDYFPIIRRQISLRITYAYEDVDVSIFSLSSHVSVFRLSATCGGGECSSGSTWSRTGRRGSRTQQRPRTF